MAELGHGMIEANFGFVAISRIKQADAQSSELKCRHATKAAAYDILQGIEANTTTPSLK
jgi:hypothetical protein